MNKRHARLVLKSLLSTTVFGILLIRQDAERALAVSPPTITSMQISNGKLALAWTGDSFSYEVQQATVLDSTNWISYVATARTNVTIPLSGTSGFFRVIDPDTNLVRLDLMATNLNTGDVVHLIKRPQTNDDLVFTNITAGDYATLTISAGDIRKFDMAFDGSGSFWFVTPDGEPTQLRGYISRSPVPGTNEVYFAGYLTDGTNQVTFAAIAADPVLSVGDAAFSAWWCAPAWAVQNLQCQAAAFGRNFPCAFAGKGGGYGVITSQTGVTITGTNILGECASTCMTCCKNGNNPPTDCQ